jgi:hypothetical protein
LRVRNLRTPRKLHQFAISLHVSAIFGSYYSNKIMTTNKDSVTAQTYIESRNDDFWYVLVIFAYFIPLPRFRPDVEAKFVTYSLNRSRRTPVGTINELADDIRAATGAFVCLFIYLSAFPLFYEYL